MKRTQVTWPTAWLVLLVALVAMTLAAAMPLVPRAVVTADAPAGEFSPGVPWSTSG